MKKLKFIFWVVNNLLPENKTLFSKDIKRGKIGEIIFKEDFLDFLGIKYQDVTKCQKFQIIDSDYITKIGLYEIKNNYKDDKQLIVEEYTNINKELGPISKGWFYKTKADLLISLSKETRTMIFIPMVDTFKKHYEKIKDKYKLNINKISIDKNGNKWQSAYRRISLEDIKGFYSMYKKIS